MKGIVSNFQKKRGSDGDGDGAARPFAGPAPSNTSFVSESEHVIDIDNAGSQACCALSQCQGGLPVLVRVCVCVLHLLLSPSLRLCVRHGW